MVAVENVTTPEDRGFDDLLRESTRRWQDARDAAASLRRARAELMLRLHQEGASWEQIALAAGSVSAGAAREWARQYAKPDEVIEGVSVAEAARLLGVTRQTVYARVRAGQLRSVVDRNGKTRVLLDED